MLTISPVGTPTRDRVIVKVVVTNEGKKPVVWDSEFSTFLRWDVDGLDAKGTKRAGDWSTKSSDRSLLTEEEWKSRFRTLDPGRSLSKEIDLTKSVRVFASGHASGGPRDHEQTGYESIAQFKVPPEAGGLRISIEYRLQSDDKGGFYVCFGRRFSGTGLTEEEFRSNTLEFLLP
jgi:hypothetical protein